MSRRPARSNGARRYGGVPAHARVAARRASFLAAGRDLLGRVGLGGTTVRGLCDAAGLNQRYFYESFPSVEALAAEVADAIAEEVIEQATAAVSRLEARDVRARAHAVFSTLIGFVAEQPTAARIMFVETSGNGPELAAWRQKMLYRGAQVNELLMLRDDDGDDDLDPATALADHVTAIMITGGVIEVLVAWLDGNVDAEPEQLASILADAVEAGVTGPGGAGLRVAR
jgi:AcrR family transcriptional regulator